MTAEQMAQIERNRAAALAKLSKRADHQCESSAGSQSLPPKHIVQVESSRSENLNLNSTASAATSHVPLTEVTNSSIAVSTGNKDIACPEKRRVLPFGQAAPKKRTLPKSMAPSENRSIIPLAESLPRLRYLHSITYCNEATEAEEVTMLLAAAAERDGAALGFDIEWFVTFQSGVAPRRVATIQLCAADICVVYQCSSFLFFPPALARLLGDPDVKKVGIGASRDAIKVRLCFM